MDSLLKERSSMKRKRRILLFIILSIIIQPNRTSNDEYFIDTSRALSAEKYPEVHLDEYLEKTALDDPYFTVYYSVPNELVWGGGGPWFVYDYYSRDLVFDGLQY